VPTMGQVPINALTGQVRLRAERKATEVLRLQLRRLKGVPRAFAVEMLSREI
jgi:hypothetical protein